ncbi:MAG: formyltransferase family protein [Candidatus Omnitrophica bacterium]|nr:formyltransferase family protein [Candidatus Omnitrophota bacterium]MDD5591884.1 formyltransferase family protein [Candidatus Omnitrophota bacterium]
MKIALFTKPDKPTVNEVKEYLKKNFDTVAIYEGERGESIPLEALNGSQDILISYLSPWLIPEQILNKTALWSINFHPGPPEYPGIGCFNFAIYNQEKYYGITAHLMEKNVDSGKIIAVKRFSMLRNDSVYTLSIKSYECMYTLFYEIMDSILTKNIIPFSNETWKRKPYTRSELEELCRIEAAMPQEEIKKRVKATAYPGMPGAYIELYGHKFEYNANR